MKDITQNDNYPKFGLPIPQPLLSNYGPIMFGGCGAKFRVVHWRKNGKRGIICGGVGGATNPIRYYEERPNSRSELQFVYIKTLAPYNPDYITYPTVIDWSGNGTRDIIFNTRNTMLYLSRSTNNDELPDYAQPEPVKDIDGIPFSFEYHHPDHEIDTLNGYTDERYHNYLCTEVFDWYGDGGRDLLVGDETGVIWLLEDVSQDRGEPKYHSEHYTKRSRRDDPTSPSYKKSRFEETTGQVFAKPTRMLTDIDGKTIRVGHGCWGNAKLAGFCAKPSIVDWDRDGNPDLLIPCGDRKDSEIVFYRNVGKSKDGSPLLKYEGQICDYQGNKLGLPRHDFIVVTDWFGNGRNDMLLGDRGHIKVYKNISDDARNPTLKFESYLCQENVQMAINMKLHICDYNNDGKNDIVEGGTDGMVRVRFNVGTTTTPLFSADPVFLTDDKGNKIRVFGETDPTAVEEYGDSSPLVTDWDNDGIPDLLLGSDTGHIYFYKGMLDKSQKYPTKFVDKGKLCDGTGKIIKVHNRTDICLLDIDGDGTDELLISGVTYQLGHKTDTDIGGDVVYFKIVGRNSDGVPILSERQPFIVDGKPIKIMPNQNTRIKPGDFNHDGKIELFFWCNSMGNNIIRYRNGKTGSREWYFAETIAGGFGLGVPGDIDNDGWVEFVYGGGESGRGVYYSNFWKDKDVS
ncbi:MAG: VCBS repeat-containing protein [Elusimicrobiota bacterium]